MVGHDSEATIDVGNCNTPGCYSRAINYGGATTRQLAALVDLSTSCRQSIRVSSSFDPNLILFISFFIVYSPPVIVISIVSTTVSVLLSS